MVKGATTKAVADSGGSKGIAPSTPVKDYLFGPFGTYFLFFFNYFSLF